MKSVKYYSMKIFGVALASLICLLGRPANSFLTSRRVSIVNNNNNNMHSSVVVVPFELLLFVNANNNNNEEKKPQHEVAIEHALKVSRKYGATSQEARIAWEIAEEIEDSYFSPCSQRCDYPPQRTKLSNLTNKQKDDGLNEEEEEDSIIVESSKE